MGRVEKLEVADNNGVGGQSRIGHLEVDYSNLHVVAAILTQATLDNYDNNSDVMTRFPLEDLE